MLLNLCNNSEGVFKHEFRRQLLASLSVTIITFCHGTGLGWLSPLLTRLQSPADTPLSFAITVEQASWIGSLISIGGIIGIIMVGYLQDRFGRKAAIYFLAFPQVCLWVLLYSASSVEFLYAARVCGGISGGGCFVVAPIFIGEIADPTIRGRLTSIFQLAYNSGILTGFILSTHVAYHLIPCVMVVLPILYFVLATQYPETPQHLLRSGCEAEAEQSLKYYRNYRGTSKQDVQHFDEFFSELKSAVMQQNSQKGNVQMKDFFTKSALKAIVTGVILVAVNVYCGLYGIINYMSIIFTTAKTVVDPNTNTIIIGVVQIVGTYTATLLVDRYGRKILMLVSTAGMGTGLAAFGLYAYFAEATTADLSYFSSWLPLLLMAFIIFIANVGIMSVTFVILVEIMPSKIRSKATTFCLFLLSAFCFGLLKVFPICIHAFGLSTTMWVCASVCAFGLFYVTVFLKETKGKSMDTNEADN